MPLNRALCTLLLAASLAPQAALAQAPQASADAALALAQQGLEGADFLAVDAALDRAAQSDMTSRQLRQWLELRVLVAYADERFGALEVSLAGLVSLDLTAPASPSFPRSVRARYEELQSEGVPIELRAELTAAPRGDGREVGLVVVTQNDPGRLVRSTRVHARVAAGDWRVLEPSERIAIASPRSSAVVVQYWIEARGPGDALIAQRGSANEPLLGEVAGLPEDETPLHVGVTVAGISVVAGVVALIIAALVTDGFRDGNSVVRGPTCDACAAASPLSIAF